MQRFSIYNGTLDDLVKLYNQEKKYLTRKETLVPRRLVALMLKMHRLDPYHVCQKDRHAYRQMKFEKVSHGLKRKLAEAYMTGLCFVYRYYFYGVPSWSWYYPFFYGPFASDFKYASHDCTLTLDHPLSPFEQLMATLPPSSAHLLPRPLAELMTHPDLIQYYPQDFEIDRDGVQHDWQGVVLVPFVNMKRVKRRMRKKDALLTEKEQARNRKTTPKVLLAHGRRHHTKLDVKDNSPHHQNPQNNKDNGYDKPR